MEQKTEASQAVDAPMPSGVEKMTKQELWNWFQRYARAIAVKSEEEKRFFRLTTGLHDARMMTNPLEIIEAQRKRMAGLELQMTQMQKGYDKKLKKALKAQPAPTEAPSEQKPFAWAYRAVNSDNWHATTDKEWAHAIQNMERKPLYEHPAPTEAAQGAQLSGNSGELAQGEDSARLEFGDITSVVHNDRGAQHTLMVYFKTTAGRDEFRDAFGDMVLKDRARASAETGGMK